jgi:iron(III) transport system ATP-binding protein
MKMAEKSVDEAFIDVRQVSKRYAGTKIGITIALKEISFTVQKGMLTALLGPSGCGKTSTLRMIAGLETPDEGEVWLEGRRVAGNGAWLPPEVRRVGMVFQDGALFPHLTVAQNIAFPLKTRHAQQRTQELLAMIGLQGFAERYPHQLSGGQQQRVALARALAANPSVVLLDEPFSRLDASLRMSLREEVRSIVKQAQATTIFVTHDQEEALSIADRIVIMFEGSVAQVGAPLEIYTRPATRQVATFVGDANFVPGYAAGATVDSALGRLILANPCEGAVDVMIRPEALELMPARNGNACIERINYFGHDQAMHLRLNDGRSLMARTLPRPDLEVGERVSLQVRGVVVGYRRG